MINSQIKQIDTSKFSRTASHPPPSTLQDCPLFTMKPKAPPKTHFICLPLRTPAFRSKVTSFNALLPNTVPPSIIRPTGSLHFTLGVLSLSTAEEINSAVKFLHSCHSDALTVSQGSKINVTLRGIASMQGNIKRTSVIYAVPEEGDGRLRSLCSISPDMVDKIYCSLNSRRPRSWIMIDMRRRKSRYSTAAEADIVTLYIIEYIAYETATQEPICGSYRCDGNIRSGRN